MHAVIYARYSSENQREASIEDQLEVCRRYAARMGFRIEATYEDRAISGANSSNRPGYQQLLRDARKGQFDVLVVEALDRLARKLSDIAGTFDELQFNRIALHAVNVGVVTTMHVGMIGTMAQMFLSDLRDKTKRGQLGRVLQGRAAAGKAFGYDVLDDDEGGGGRQINRAEAATVERIFHLFANGVSPRAIARRLNQENVPGPEGRPWQDTTIRGQKERGTGILNNELYIGELVWNRCSYVKDPRTGKRVARPNPPEQWERKTVSELRIIDDALWRSVKARQEQTGFAMGKDPAGNALNRAHRRQFLLSGLLVCGECGGGYTIMAKDRYGCSSHRSKGTCKNDRTIGRMEIEDRILVAIKERLLTAELVAEFTRGYQEEVNRLARDANGRQSEIEGKLTTIQRKIDSMIKAIEDGLYQPTMKDRMTELEAEKARLLVEQKDTPTLPAISVHPNLAELYRKRVQDLENLLVDPDARDEAMELIRSMIEKIVLTPKSEGGMAAELHGDLARILQICAGSAKQNTPGLLAPGCLSSVVAGAGFEPAAFRL
jgi:site-specific DNA recombinase